jgi:hypothetical protein
VVGSNVQKPGEKITMTERRSIHPNYKVNMRRFAADERKMSEQGYVVKFGNGAREYFKSFRAAQEFQEKLVKAGHWKEHVQIINIANQRDTITKVKKDLSVRVGGKSFYGSGLTGNEIALMVLGRMCEATSHQFRCTYPTMEMRKAAQRALKHMIRKDQGRMTDTVKAALELKLHTVGERKP